MELYCPLVSVGCYCIVEDTKMSRWSSTGPHEAVQKFLKKHPEFELVSTGSGVTQSGTLQILRSLTPNSSW